MNGDHSSPSLSDTGVFVSYACNQAYGFRQTSLAPLWHYSGPCEGGGGRTTVYANGNIFTRDFFGNLILDALTGTVQSTFGGTYTPAPAVDATSVYSLNPPTLYAQSLSGGQTRWTFNGDGNLTSAPIVIRTASGEFVIVGSSSGMLYALDAATGAQVWSANVGGGIPAPDEHNAGNLTGLAAGRGLLVVPNGNNVSAYTSGGTLPDRHHAADDQGPAGDHRRGDRAFGRGGLLHGDRERPRRPAGADHAHVFARIGLDVRARDDHRHLQRARRRGQQRNPGDVPDHGAGHEASHDRCDGEHHGQRDEPVRSDGDVRDADGDRSRRRECAGDLHARLRIVVCERYDHRHVHGEGHARQHGIGGVHRHGPQRGGAAQCAEDRRDPGSGASRARPRRSCATSLTNDLNQGAQANLSKACKALALFITDVQANTAPRGPITSAHSDAWIAAANDIRRARGC